MARIATTTANSGLDGMLTTSTTYYLALFTTDPGTTGASGEVSGGSYARQSIVFAAASSGSKASNTAQTFTNVPSLSGGAPYFGIFSAASGGTYIAGGTTNSSTAISAGSSITVASGAITFSLS